MTTLSGKTVSSSSRASLLVSAGVQPYALDERGARADVRALNAPGWHLTHTVTAESSPSIRSRRFMWSARGISDQIGRRATMLAGLFASLVGALLFAVALTRGWVFAGVP